MPPPENTQKLSRDGVLTLEFVTKSPPHNSLLVAENIHSAVVLFYKIWCEFLVIYLIKYNYLKSTTNHRVRDINVAIKETRGRYGAPFFIARANYSAFFGTLGMVG